MATFSCNIPDDFLDSLLKCDSEELCKEILTEAAPELEKSMKKEIEKHNDTGELQKSIKAGKPFLNKNGFWQITVSPRGYSKNYYYGGKQHNRKYKLTNAAKAIFLEYGTSHQTARPFLTKSTNNAERGVINKLQENYERNLT